MQKIRLLSYNIHKGFTPRNTDFILNQIRDAIREVNADIVCLQEVIGEHSQHQNNHEGWHPGGQFEFLADSIWPHYAYGKNAIYQHGHHGNAILSQYPFSQWQNIDITRWKFSQRGILHGRIGEHLHILCTHFGFLPFEQRYQLQCLKKYVDDNIPADTALIIAGDFNDWHQQIHRTLIRDLKLSEVSCSDGGRPSATFPATWPCLPMDRIYFRNLTLHSATILQHHHWQQLSDHCPVIAEFSVYLPQPGLAA